MITITLNDGTPIAISDGVTYEELEKVELGPLERDLLITRLEFLAEALGGRRRHYRAYGRYNTANRVRKTDFEENDNGYSAEA